MKILLLGANGRTGRHVLHHALGSGDDVTAVVRGADRLADVHHPRLDIRVADPCVAKELTAIGDGHDVVISTLGPRWPTRNSSAVYADSGASMVEAFDGTEVKRVILTSSALLFSTARFRDTMLRALVPRIVESASLMEEYVRASALQWTIVRTGFLVDSDRTDSRHRVEAFPEGAKAVSRVALALFLLNVARDRSHVRQVVGLCG